MSTAALRVSPNQILEVNASATKAVAFAQGCVDFALTILGHFADFMGASVVDRLNERLRRQLVGMKGMAAVVREADPNTTIDEDSEIVGALDHLQSELNQLHATYLKARNDMKLRRTHEAFREGSSLCTSLHEAVAELKAAIRGHDAKANLGDDTRRLMADLRRTDDVPVGLYAELAAVIRTAPRTETRAASRRRA